MTHTRSGPAPAVRPSILVLDDRPANLDVIAAILSGIHADLVFATTGQQALELSEQHELAAALLDVCVPGTSGIEVAAELRSRQPALPIIMVTAVDRSPESQLRAYSAGSVDYLYKPIEPSVLRAKVQVFLDLFSLRKQDRLRAQELESLRDVLIAQRADARHLASELALQKEELECQNRELQLRNSQLNSFTHVVSHDLRQPLGSILDYVELIENSLRGPANSEASRWIQSCLTLGHGMQTLIEEILEYSRLGGGAAGPEARRCQCRTHRCPRRAARGD